MTRFLTELKCQVCGKAMRLIEPDGGFHSPWPEEDERGNTIAEHWSRDWVCECGVHASEGAVDNDPFSDDTDRDYLMPDGEALDWYDKDGKPLDEVELPPELQHDGFYYTTPAGNAAHIQGDPDMPQEALDALSRMIDAVVESIKDGTFGEKSDKK